MKIVLVGVYWIMIFTTLPPEGGRASNCASDILKWYLKCYKFPPQRKGHSHYHHYTTELPFYFLFIYLLTLCSCFQ